MIGSVDFGVLAEDNLDIVETVGAELAPCHRRPRAAVSGLGIGDIDEPVRCEVGIELDVEQPALAFGENLRHALERFRYRPVLGNDAKPSGSLGHQHAIVWQESETPRVFETVRNRLNLDRARFGVDRRVLGDARLRHQHQGGRR